MKLLDGRKLSNNIYSSLVKRDNVKLAVIIVGNKEDSKLYVKMKKNMCNKMGIDVHVEQVDEDNDQNKIKEIIKIFNNDSSITGIMVQLPLPKNLESYSREILDTINPRKDVDGLTSHSMGKLALNVCEYIPCTPAGIIELLKHNNIKIEGEDVVIIGKSNIVGLPLSLMLSNLDATVSLCHIKTKNIKNITKNADILIVCCGCPKLITKDHIKKGAIIIDVGINVSYEENKKKIVGDVDFDSVKDIAGGITPVPGGVGPMTICMLIKQLLQHN